MNIEEVLYLPVKREGLNIGPGEFDCKHCYITLDGEEVASSYKAKTKEELLDRQKPEVPQCVADWYEDHKGNLEYNLYLYQMSIYDEKVEKDDFYYWMQKSKNPVRTLINMHQFGYTVEKEKLYTVEIPNPNAEHSRIILQRLTKNELHLSKYTSEDWKEYKMNQLTESEIRKDFDWAWQFAKEVE